MLVSSRGRNALLGHVPPGSGRHPSLRWSRWCRDESRGLLPPLLPRLGWQKGIPEPVDEQVGRLDVRARDPNITREKLREGWFD